jgi:hypothetical protein
MWKNTPGYADRIAHKLSELNRLYGEILWSNSRLETGYTQSGGGLDRLRKLCTKVQQGAWTAFSARCGGEQRKSGGVRHNGQQAERPRLRNEDEKATRT